MPDDDKPAVDGHTPIDAIAHSLRRQHLHHDGPSTAPLEVDPMLLDTTHQHAPAPDGPPPDVPHDIAHHAPLQGSAIQAFMNRSRSDATLALESHGFPLYRTSKEVALRSRNLVRNKPRMRKRPKLSRKPTTSAIPAASGLTLAPPTSKSSRDRPAA